MKFLTVFKEENRTLPKKKIDIHTIELEDIQGIGSETANKLRAAGIDSVDDLSVANAEDLAIMIRSSKDVAQDYIRGAFTLLREAGAIDQLFQSAAETEEKRKNMMRLTTGSEKFDEFLLGGIETQALTEIYGEFGSGKSQICHTLAINSTLPKEVNGYETGCIYIDTEGTFRPERVREMCGYKKINADETLQKIMHCKPLTASQLELLARDITKFVKQYNVRLVIVDSVIALHRSDYLGRGNLNERQNKLSLIVRKLIKVAAIFNIAIVVTNQVVADPSITYGDPMKPTGGNVIGHLFTYRMRIDKIKQSVTDRTRKVRWMDSPYHPIMECVFEIGNAGIVDKDGKSWDYEQMRKTMK